MIARFFRAVREEGWRVAFAKTRSYLAMRLSGAGRSVFGRGSAGGSGNYLSGFWQEIAQKDAFHVSQAPAVLTKARRIAMIGDLNLPQCRKYRVEQPAEFWAKLGVEYSYAHYQDIPRAVAALQNATHLMFYRTRNDDLKAMYLYEARRLRLPVLYDLDDPLFSVSAYETYENMKALPKRMKAHFLAEAPKYQGAMDLADIVTVSTPGMAEHARLYTARPVRFRRNFADQATLAAAEAALAGAPRDPAAPFRVAFASGSMGHEVDFGLISDDITGFLDADPNRQLLILGHFDEDLLPETLRGRVEAHAFTTYDRYLENLATADCAVMPLTDDLFNRCKSAVRVIDAAAVAVPSLVGRVSDMAHMVREGETGRVLGPNDSWRDALEALARDRAGAHQMGQAARADLQANWTARPDLPIVEQEIIDWVRA